MRFLPAILFACTLAAPSFAVAAGPANTAIPSKGAAVPLARVALANRKAIQEPSSTAFVNAVQHYSWSEGAIFRLYTAPGTVSDVALQPGETLTSVAAGDTVRWIIGDTTSGSGSAKQTHILVKPAGAGLKTNMIVTTDRRVYLIALESHPSASMAGISWSYPEDALLALVRAREAEPVAGGIAVDQLNFNYRIEGARASWRPIRVFDDGRQVFIEFPPSIGTGEIPPLFVIGSSGKAELVNYRLRGRYYVVDRLFGTAELRLGVKRQQIVRIIRAGAPLSRGRG